jgi:hypothetical protein
MNPEQAMRRLDQFRPCFVITVVAWISLAASLFTSPIEVADGCHRFRPVRTR